MKKLLPKMSVTLRCEECKKIVERFDVNVRSLASRLFAARREHARKAGH